MFFVYLKFPKLNRSLKIKEVATRWNENKNKLINIWVLVSNNNLHKKYLQSCHLN